MINHYDVKYTINLLGLPLMVWSALLVMGAIPINGLDRAETILTAFAIMLLSDTVKYTLTGTAQWMKWVVVSIVPTYLLIAFYGVLVLLAGAH